MNYLPLLSLSVKRLGLLACLTHSRTGTPDRKHKTNEGAVVLLAQVMRYSIESPYLSKNTWLCETRQHMQAVLSGLKSAVKSPSDQRSC